jgi:hypothetical protein
MHSSPSLATGQERDTALFRCRPGPDAHQQGKDQAEILSSAAGSGINEWQEV